MSYTPPDGDKVNFSWEGYPPYTPPAGDAVNFTWVPAVTGAILKAWDGADWIPGILKRWSGSAWVVNTLKRWSGTEWLE